MMLQHDRPEDFVIASGVAHRLDEFVSAAFAEVGLAWQDHVECDDSLRRPTDIRYSRGRPLEGGTATRLATKGRLCRDNFPNGACGTRENVANLLSTPSELELLK